MFVSRRISFHVHKAHKQPNQVLLGVCQVSAIKQE